MDARYGEIRVFWHALDEHEQLFMAQIPESPCFWLATVAVEIRARHVCLAPQPGMPSAAGRLVHCEAQILALVLRQVADLE